MRLPINSYKGQFIIGKNFSSSPDHWIRRSLGNLQLAFCPSLHIKAVNLKSSNKTIGYILGFFVHPDTTSSSDLNITGVSEEQFCQRLYECYGRYIGIFCSEGNPTKIFIDPSGSMPVVYSRKHSVVASTPGPALGDDYFEDFNDQLYSHLNMPASDLWFPGRLTPHTTFQRLLPNHVLDLETFEAIRHWPTEQPTYSNSPDIDSNEVGKLLKSCITHFFNNYKIQLSLTAGRDARMLIAAANSLVHQISFFTFCERFETVDEFYARKISKDFELDWRRLKICNASETERKRWLIETGHAVSGSIWNIHPTLKKLNPQAIIAPAMGGEVGRAFYWRESDHADDQLSADGLLKRLKLPQIPEFRTSLNHWLDSVNQFDLYTQLDLAYIELRLGCWGSPQIYGNLKFGEHIYPFSHRRIFQTMLSLPPYFRYNNNLPEQLIESWWPELYRYPFNEFKGIYKIKGLFLKALQIPGYIQRKVIPSFKN